MLHRALYDDQRNQLPHQVCDGVDVIWKLPYTIEAQVIANHKPLNLNLIMSWNLEYRYAALELQEIKSPEELHLLLQSFASSILQEYRETANIPDCMEDVAWDMEHGEFSSDDEIIKAITQIASLYLDEVEHTEDGATLTVRSEYDSEYYDTDFADQLAGYLFSKSHNPYFLIRHAAFSDWGGCSHPWIGRRKDGAVVVEYLPDCLDALLQEPAAAVLA